MSSTSPQSSPAPEDGTERQLTPPLDGSADGDRQSSPSPAETKDRCDAHEGMREAIQPLDLFTEETVDKLAGGFLAVFEPELVRVLSSLEELVTNQEEMLQSIHQKRMQFEDTTKATEILATLQKAPLYRHKVSSIVKEMHTLNKRVKRLQQRSSKLKESRVGRDAQKRKVFEQTMERERLLEAKPSK